MEYINCTYCGCDDTDLLFEGRDLWYDLPGRFFMHRCRHCGLIYLNPQPDREEISRYYPEQYKPHEMAASQRNVLQRLSDRYGLYKRVALMEARLPQRGRVLDVGCGDGQFLQAMSQHGWEPYGVETGASAATHARTQLGLNVFHGELQDAQFESQYFDLVTMWHVLEHVHEPRATLREAARITRPGGLFFATIPNPDSLEARLFGPVWAGWDVPRHLNIFPQELLHGLLAQTGWEVQETVWTAGRLWLFNLSLRHWLEMRGTHPAIQRLVTSITGSFLANILTRPLFLALERLQKSSILAVFARRVSDSPVTNEASEG